VSDLPIEGLRRRVLSEAEHVASPQTGQASRPGDEKKPQGAQAAEHIGVRPLAGPRLRLRHGVQLEASDQVCARMPSCYHALLAA
jgi:hypothetical protein